MLIWSTLHDETQAVQKSNTIKRHLNPTGFIVLTILRSPVGTITVRFKISFFKANERNKNVTEV